MPIGALLSGYTRCSQSIRLAALGWPAPPLLALPAHQAVLRTLWKAPLPEHSLLVSAARSVTPPAGVGVGGQGGGTGRSRKETRSRA